MINISSCGYLYGVLINPNSYSWILGASLFICGAIVALSTTTMLEFKEKPLKNTLFALAAGGFISITLTVFVTGFIYLINSHEITKEQYHKYSIELSWLKKAEPKNPKVMSLIV